MTEATPVARLSNALAGHYRVERELGAGGMATFRQRDTVMTVSVNPDRREIGTPTMLFTGAYVFQIPWDEGRSYDVSQDGETFLMLREPTGGQRRRIVVTLNWLAELKAKVQR